MTGKRQNDGTLMPAYMMGHTGYLFTTGFNNHYPYRGEFGNIYEITNYFALRESGAFVSSDLPPLHSYD